MKRTNGCIASFNETVMRNRLINYGITIIGIVALVYLAIACATNSPNIPTEASEAYYRGLRASNANNYDLAIAEFTEAIRLYPDYADAYDGRGMAYFYKDGNYDHAIADLEAALKINPNKVLARAHLATARRLSGGETSTQQQVAQSPVTPPSSSSQQTALTPAAPPPPTPSPYFTGDGGRRISLGIGTPRSQGLTADQSYLPTLVQGVLVDSISKYSQVQVLDRVSLDRVIAETLDPTFEDNLDIVRLGHVAHVDNWLTGNIIRTSSGFTLQLNITDTTPNAATVASYTGTTTVADFDNHTAIRRAALALLEGMGVTLTDMGKAELAQASRQETVQAQVALSRGIVAQRQGNNNGALDYYTQAVTLDPALPEASSRFSALADRIQGTRLAEKFDWLRAFAQTNGSYIFEITADENIPEQTLSFSGRRNITLTLRGRGANRTLSLLSDRYNYSMFTVSSGVSLVLDNNITLRRGRVNVSSGGTLIMNKGSTITGVEGELDGGGVYVDNGGIFTMNGGAISGNTAGVGYGGSHGYGGGVYVAGTFTMNDGAISDNTAYYGGGGVLLKGGTFTMNNGIISGNKTNGNSYRDSGGGGVNVSGGTFIMSGGTIASNSTTNGGSGGVFVYSGTFTMSGGNISNNNSNAGGGVYVNDTFTMSGGIISGNSTSRDRYGYGGYGGGVYVEAGEYVNGTFIMRGGTIAGNTALEKGGGVYICGTFTMSNGTISGNTARENGGGVYVDNYRGIFTKTGGTIYGYSAGDANSNVVRDDSGAVRNYQGHAVSAGVTTRLLKIKESTAGTRDNLSYDGSKTPPIASGAWDN